MTELRQMLLPRLPGLTGGEALAAGTTGDGHLFRLSDSVTGAPRLVRLGPDASIRSEAAILAKLKDVAGVTHLVDQQAVGDGLSVLVTELAEGVSVETACTARSMPWGPAVRIALALAEVLGSVHAAGVIHGAVRPEHIVFTAYGPVVTGFGAATAIGAPYRASGEQLGWAAPEAGSGGVSAAPAVDVYSLAATLYALIAGSGVDGAKKTPAARAAEVEPLTRAGLPRTLAAVMAAALAPDALDRYSTMAEFSAALAAVLGGAEPPLPAVASQEPLTRREPAPSNTKKAPLLPATDPVPIAMPARQAMPPSIQAVVPVKETWLVPDQTASGAAWGGQAARNVPGPTRLSAGPRPLRSSSLDGPRNRPRTNARATASEEPTASRASGTLAVLAATVLVVGLAVTIWWSGRASLPDLEGQAETSGGSSLMIGSDDPLPVLADGAVTVDSTGDPYFAWTNPAPLPGDQYRWSLLGTPERTHLTGEVRVAVPRREFGVGPVCVEVRLIRDDKTSQDLLRICEG
ncbi:MAG: hypothetical protein LBJ02_03515 [Bifidobacteriaceae bacterium]|jgi:serine/threonine protein kinase|nr:hypothetical protein [Bifidobacteriaceae bacterium]